MTNDTMCVEICSQWFVLQVICNTNFVSYRKINVSKRNVTHRVQWFDQWWETSNQPHKSSSFLVFFLEISLIYVAWQMCPTTSVLNEPRTKKISRICKKKPGLQGRWKGGKDKKPHFLHPAVPLSLLGSILLPVVNLVGKQVGLTSDHCWPWAQFLCLFCPFLALDCRPMASWRPQKTHNANWLQYNTNKIFIYTIWVNKVKQEHMSFDWRLWSVQVRKMKQKYKHIQYNIIIQIHTIQHYNI